MRHNSSAASPEAASITSNPHARTDLHRMLRCRRLSSTINAKRRRAPLGASSARSGRGFGAVRCIRLDPDQNSLPDVVNEQN